MVWKPDYEFIFSEIRRFLLGPVHSFFIIIVIFLIVFMLKVEGDAFWQMTFQLVKVCCDHSPGPGFYGSSLRWNKIICIFSMFDAGVVILYKSLFLICEAVDPIIPRDRD